MAVRKVKPAESQPTPLEDKPCGNTSWKNGVPANGWYRMPDEWWRHLPRLQRGLYQRMLIEYVWASTVPREKDGKMPEWSAWFSYVEIAAIFRCSPEQVRDDARNAAKRGLMAMEAPEGSRGKVRFQITWERWANIKDYVAPGPAEVPKKPQPKVRWLSRAVTVEPGATFDLPKLDFPVERISLRNTSERGNIKIGAGSCEGGVLVLETAAESVPVESKVSDKSQVVERDSTPVKSRETPPKPKEKPATDPVVQQIAETVGSYGPVTIPAITRMIAAAHATPELVLESLSVVKPPDNADNPVGWVLMMVPRYFAGAYKPAESRKKKQQSERDRRAFDAMGVKIA